MRRSRSLAAVARMHRAVERYGRRVMVGSRRFSIDTAREENESLRKSSERLEARYGAEDKASIDARADHHEATDRLKALEDQPRSGVPVAR